MKPWVVKCQMSALGLDLTLSVASIAVAAMSVKMFCYYWYNVSRRSLTKGVRPSPYQLDAGVIISPTPLFVLIFYSAKGSLSQFCKWKCKGGCHQIQTQDFLVAPTAIIESSSRLSDRGHRSRVYIHTITYISIYLILLVSIDIFLLDFQRTRITTE